MTSGGSSCSGMQQLCVHVWIGITLYVRAERAAVIWGVWGEIYILSVRGTARCWTGASQVVFAQLLDCTIGHLQDCTL